MQVLSVFTVNNGNVCHGTPVERYVLPSKRVISAVLIGDSNRPAYLPVRGVCPREQGGQVAPQITAASIDYRFPWMPEFVMATSEDVTDKTSAIVVLRTDVGRENFHCGRFPEIPLPGVTLAKGRILPCRQKKLGEWLGRGAVQVVQCVPQGAVFSTIVNYDGNLQILRSYQFDGETVESVPPAFPMF